jgi:hypothetical protein
VRVQEVQQQPLVQPLVLDELLEQPMRFRQYCQQVH